jgi:hypothetical protein
MLADCTRSYFAYNCALSLSFAESIKMPIISLPDGSDRQFDTATNGAMIAASIGEGLARAAVAVRVDGELWDLESKS